MPSPLSSATAEITETLQDSILPALKLAKAGVMGIGIPGVEGAVNGVYELANMIPTMKSNKKDLSILQNSIGALAALKVMDAPMDLKKRLTKLSGKMTARSEECKALGTKSTLNRFLKSDEYSRKILDIRNAVAEDICEFTFQGNISIEKLVTDIAAKVVQILTNNTLGRLKYSAARYNAENTPDECMDETRTDIIKEILELLTAPPDENHRLVILSGSAGSGKSTIAKSIAAVLAAKGDHLAASFFFSRDFAERSNIKLLPTTLARQLADYSPDYCHLLVKFLDEDHTDILSADPRLQFQTLVVELLAKIPWPAMSPLDFRWD
ncbi:hypothetical protein B0H11DRAFT_2413844 [Mycena galericulata]|nr:hypothetical protein B0H11DRAFT_2413844 [Mycena galericulata]